MPVETPVLVEAPAGKPSMREILAAAPFALRFMYGSDRVTFIKRIALSVLEGPLTFVAVIATKHVTDAIVAREARAAYTWASVIVLTMVLSDMAGSFRERYENLLRFSLEFNLQRRGAEQLMRIPHAVFDQAGFQQLYDAYRRKAHVMLNLCDWIPVAARRTFNLLGLLALFLYIPWQVILVVCIAFVSRLAVNWNESKRTWTLFSMENREGRRAQYYIQMLGSLRGLAQAKGLGFQQNFFERWSTLAKALLSQRRKNSLAITHMYLLCDLLEAAGMALGLWLMLRAYFVGTCTVGAFVAFLTGYGQMWNTFMDLSEVVRSITREGSFFVVFKRFFDIPHRSDVGARLPSGPLVVQFEDVWFRYPGTDVDVLKGVNFEFAEGEKLALVGLNGAGKSTLLKLLCGLYRPTAGRILVNGKELSDLRPSAWTDTLVIMNQDPYTFDDPVRTQVRYAEDANGEDVARFASALQVSGLDKVVEDLPQGLDTHAGKAFAMPEDKSIELSGGQNQILTIARTLYRDARVYVFDEPTSAVDAQKEEGFFEALPKALGDSAVIFVSHRFSTVRRAERILVLEEGRVREEGSHEELMHRSERYAELFTTQARMYQ